MEENAVVNALNSAIDGCIAAIALALVKYKLFEPSAIFAVVYPTTLSNKLAVKVPVGDVIGLFVEFAESITLPEASVTTIVFAVWLIEPEFENLIELPYNHKSRNGLSLEPIS